MTEGKGNILEHSTFCFLSWSIDALKGIGDFFFRADPKGELD